MSRATGSDKDAAINQDISLTLKKLVNSATCFHHPSYFPRSSPPYDPHIYFVLEMDINYSAFASSPSFLLYGFDGAFPRSEGSSIAPAHSPTFYKCGESSRLSDMKPVFHSSTSDSYKIWCNSSLRGEENDLSFSPCQETRVWKDGEMEFDTTSYGSPYHRRSYPDAATQWPTRDNTVSCYIPVSVTRSSLSCPQYNQTSYEADWRGSPLEDDLFGPTSPLSLTSATSFENANLLDSGDSMVRPQLHNYHYDSTGSPHHRPSASSQSVSIVSPITIASPNLISSSPASASSYSSVSTASSSCPPTPPTPVLLPELHQPRPARPIPIIPLSKLATACEEFYMPSSKRSSVFPKPRCSSCASDLLFPMSTKFDTSVEQISHDTLQYSGDSKPDDIYPYLNSWSGHLR
ncbi:hypothetical protein H2248_001277 [Termitomyces sp. 'cryptogamus']|nr:hypothetical protein H2248_001277 [Termitomyces sp. 'cryptogamus']